MDTIPQTRQRPAGTGRSCRNHNQAAADSTTAALARILALSAMDAAREHFDAYALATDTPDPRMVDAADLLDAARDLAGAP